MRYLTWMVCIMSLGCAQRVKPASRAPSPTAAEKGAAPPAGVVGGGAVRPKLWVRIPRLISANDLIDLSLLPEEARARLRLNIRVATPFIGTRIAQLEHGAEVPSTGLNGPNSACLVYNHVGLAPSAAATPAGLRSLGPPGLERSVGTLQIEFANGVSLECAAAGHAALTRVGLNEILGGLAQLSFAGE